MKENHDHGSAIIRDIILGGQDGLVNVLGIVLAVATATSSKYIVFISGLAATFAESISMAAVAYTSAKAGKEFYRKKRIELEKRVKKNPVETRATLNDLFGKCGLQGTLLNKAIQHVMRNKKELHRVLVTYEANEVEEFAHPVRDAAVVGFAAIVGSLVPLIAFVFLPVFSAVWAALAISTVVLFASGAMKGTFTGVHPVRSGIEMMIVGMTAAIVGYVIGLLLGAVPV
ncbi:hypothetical protein COV18_02820 [Candidatus Woesearchaeota archaeon CG10_big_fil_rev_8_21_14_0_10_37_12]|nr:MAG: hypothetical protein COV18_02820 [Candidatus Woesearchaeota archaeon CG10_big_fil_rev_8_21_14_0_10_37_12]